MNRICIWLLAAASAVCLCMLPRTGTDAAKLLPAQVLVIGAGDGAITVEADNGAAGSGPTLAAALPASTQSQPRPASTMAAGTLSAHSPHARLCRGVSLSCKLHPSVLRRQQLRRADLIPADQRRARKRERQRPRVRL